MSCLQFKTMPVCCFFNHNRIVYYKYLAQGQMVNKNVYLELLKELQESAWRKSSEDLHNEHIF